MAKLQNCVYIFVVLICSLFRVVAGGDLLNIFPPGPIVAPPGATLIINCTVFGKNTNNEMQWHLPMKSSRFSIQKMGENTLQLNIVNLDEHDAGMFVCEYQLKSTKSVRIWVMSMAGRGNTTRGCSDTQFECSTGQCIFMRYRCDRIVDCPDSSDELGCSTSCRGKYLCDNGQCISQDRVCDALQSRDCRDGSDEKHCGRITEFLGEIISKRNSKDHFPSKSSEHDHGSWRFNAIYSGVAGLVGLVCVAAIVTLTVFRIHMHKRAARMQYHTQEQVRYSNNPELLQQTYPLNTRDLSGEDDFISPHRCQASTNVALNINLCVSSSPERHMGPPPYSEELSLTDNFLPPPYSTIDRRKRPDSPSEESILQPPPYSTIDRHTRSSNV